MYFFGFILCCYDLYFGSYVYVPVVIKASQDLYVSAYTLFPSNYKSAKPVLVHLLLLLQEYPPLHSERVVLIKRFTVQQEMEFFACYIPCSMFLVPCFPRRIKEEGISSSSSLRLKGETEMGKKFFLFAGLLLFIKVTIVPFCCSRM